MIHHRCIFMQYRLMYNFLHYLQMIMIRQLEQLKVTHEKILNQHIRLLKTKLKHNTDK